MRPYQPKAGFFMGKFGSSKKKLINARRQAFLLTFFDSKSHYEEKELNGFILVKHKVGNTDQHEVAIHSPQTFAIYKQLKPVPDLKRSM